MLSYFLIINLDLSEASSAKSYVESVEYSILKDAQLVETPGELLLNTRGISPQ